MRKISKCSRNHTSHPKQEFYKISNNKNSEVEAKKHGNRGKSKPKSVESKDQDEKKKKVNLRLHCTGQKKTSSIKQLGK